MVLRASLNVPERELGQIGGCNLIVDGPRRVAIWIKDLSKHSSQDGQVSGVKRLHFDPLVECIPRVLTINSKNAITTIPTANPGLCKLGFRSYVLAQRVNEDSSAIVFGCEIALSDVWNISG